MDDKNVTNGRAKLPPLSPKGAADEEGKPKKKVVRKKKKPVEEETTAEGDKPKTTPRRKKKAASASSTAGEGGESTTPKKKKRVQKQTSEQEGDPTSARSGGSQAEDVSGSKASLIKSQEGTPRKKKVKKKVKKTTEKPEGNVFDSALAEDLTAIEDDIITEEPTKDPEEKEYKKQSYTTASAILRSQPTEKFYIETNSGFKGENKNKFAKRQAEEEAEKAIVHEKPKRTTIEFAIRSHKVLQTILLFCHGLLGGICLWHIVMSYILLDYGDLDFVHHYHKLALPVNSIFFLLLVLCTVSACDRFDVGNPRRGFLVKALTLQNGTISVIIYFAALILSVTNLELEDKINLYGIKPEIWNNTSTMSGDLVLWRNLNTSRNCLSILGWFIISLAPLTDRLTENLRQTDEEELLGVDVHSTKSAIA